MRLGGSTCAVFVLVASSASAQTTHYNRIPLHELDHDLRLGAGLEIGSGLSNGGRVWAGSEAAVTTRVRPWHIFPVHFLSLDADAGALFVRIPDSYFSAGNAVSLLARVGLAVHLD